MERVAFISLLLTAVFSLSVECRFHFVNQKMNWYDAQSYCRENYTDLATINNMKDTEDLLKIPASDTVWIGLKRTWEYSWDWSDDKLVLIRENKTWKDALRYCREHQMDLVSVESDWMQRRVIEVVKDASSEEVWIGLRLSCTLGLWFWVSGETLCYHNWAPGNGTGQEDCSVGVRAGVIQSGGDHRWISLPETYQLNFICSKY
ncbi:C-type lectin domain family 4 member K-like [Xyrauchen texanus]|uniref:C-type lectin domain family 4 member K-like n=1 Tax=Xyrauchen texanus TaxID=154827 RepID=UPI00224192D9|nr:C-type lectin domain family 4 member K-like [Xyrauchen texanus]